MINAGKYRHPVKWLRFTTTASTVSGAPTGRTPEVVGSAFASVTFLTGTQVEKASQLFEGAQVQLETRTNPRLAISPDMGARINGEDYEIGAVLPVANEHEAELRILAKRVQQ